MEILLYVCQSTTHYVVVYFKSTSENYLILSYLAYITEVLKYELKAIKNNILYILYKFKTLNHH